MFLRLAQMSFPHLVRFLELLHKTKEVSLVLEISGFSFIRSTFVVTISHLFNLVCCMFIKPPHRQKCLFFYVFLVANTQLNHCTKHRGKSERGRSGHYQSVAPPNGGTGEAIHALPSSSLTQVLQLIVASSCPRCPLPQLSLCSYFWIPPFFSLYRKIPAKKWGDTEIAERGRSVLVMRARYRSAGWTPHQRGWTDAG